MDSPDTPIKLLAYGATDTHVWQYTYGYRSEWLLVTTADGTYQRAAYVTPRAADPYWQTAMTDHFGLLREDVQLDVVMWQTFEGVNTGGIDYANYPFPMRMVVPQGLDTQNPLEALS